ncbi:hypothetical protein ADL22_17225 [Streptomyces sp. NRRL F-4489]|uniref:DUF6243 family protein n=1 Tax=Streptomyces sp. NRRL F-4489 TaxID=1609095 RepID=UPI000745FCB8|nr:DUF6243 family protein [Streptomyces sp. NRRL F-4489]KUL38769.1 hypothetical protein ADL22_17225 [Streptomyces sp. NRRL F-4489]
MSKGNAGGMLGVGGTRSKLSRGALRGGANGRGRGAPGAGDPQEQRRELLRKMRERSSGT